MLLDVRLTARSILLIALVSRQFTSCMHGVVENCAAWNTMSSNGLGSQSTWKMLFAKRLASAVEPVADITASWKDVSLGSELLVHAGHIDLE